MKVQDSAGQGKDRKWQNWARKKRKRHHVHLSNCLSFCINIRSIKIGV